jgi:hypothetical protein
MGDEKEMRLLVAILVALLVALPVITAGLPQFGAHFGKPAIVYGVPVVLEDTWVDVTGVTFSIEYDPQVLHIRGIDRGSLTEYWDPPVFHCGSPGRCNVSLIYDGESYIPANSSGSIATLLFICVGAEELGETYLHFTNVRASDLNYTLGELPAVNYSRLTTKMAGYEYIWLWGP